jgi:hypothetical protein
MSKIKINMVGGGFQHDICSSALNTNKHIQWIRDRERPLDSSAEISIYIDNQIKLNPETHIPGKKNYGWLMESSAIIPHVINHVVNNVDLYRTRYKCIFTHDKNILKKSDIFKYVIPNAMPWIQNRKIYTKTKDVSIIVSNKNRPGVKGYEVRLNYLKKLLEKGIDHFGRGFKNELPWVYKFNGVTESGKLIGLKDYRFSFAFENDNYPGVFCEKLTDCFATGTIPIFWGNPEIGDFFDLNGMIIFNENLDIDSLNEDFYLSKMDSIRRNFELALNLPSSEDYIYENYLSYDNM